MFGSDMFSFLAFKKATDGSKIPIVLRESASPLPNPRAAKRLRESIAEMDSGLSAAIAELSDSIVTHQSDGFENPRRSQVFS